MWQIFEIDDIPKVFKTAVFGMICLILAAITIKVYQNFFFEGEPVHFNGGMIGVDNRQGRVQVSYSYYNNEMDWKKCLEQVDDFASNSKLFQQNDIEQGWVWAFSDNEVAVFSCGDNALNVFVASADTSRAEVLRNRIRRELTKTNKNLIQ